MRLAVKRRTCNALANIKSVLHYKESHKKWDIYITYELFFFHLSNLFLTWCSSILSPNFFLFVFGVNKTVQKYNMICYSKTM